METRDRTAFLLAFAQRLLVPEAVTPVAAFLRELAGAGEVPDAGLRVPSQGVGLFQPALNDSPGAPGLQYPWDKDPAIAQRAKAETVTVADGEQIWLITSVRLSVHLEGLLWVRGARAWSVGEQAAFAVVGHAAARRLGDWEPAVARLAEMAELQNTLEQTAYITGRLAHDFGNYLTGILGFSELTMTQLAQGSQAHRYMQEVWHGAKSGAEWVHQLHVLGRRKVPQRAKTALAPLLAEEQADRREQWGPAVTITTLVDSPLPAVDVDADSIRVLLAQLLDNAREAIADQGTVTVSARVAELNQNDCLNILGNLRAGRYVQLTIRDSGVGLPSEVRARMFVNPFFSTKPRHRGLGLAMVYGIAHAHQGGVRLGPHPDQGTAVHVFLPMGQKPDLVDEEPAQATPGRPALLVVDDDPLILPGVCQYLKDAGYNVAGASSGQEALRLYQANAFSLVITDITMPGLDGLELTRRLQALDPQVNLFFISSLSAGTLESEKELLRKYGLLRKPFEMQKLLHTVQGALLRRSGPTRP